MSAPRDPSCDSLPASPGPFQRKRPRPPAPGGAFAWTVLLFFFPGALVWPQCCTACDTPVYQYARENWTLDTYDVIAFLPPHPTAETRAALGLLDKARAGTNFVLHRATVGPGMPPPLRKIWRQLAQKPPALAALYPPRTVKKRLFWSAPLSKTAVTALLKSPVRTQLFTMLNDNHVAAVWLFLPGNNRKKNRAARKKLETLLKEMAKRAGEFMADPNTVITFPIVDVPPREAKEAFLRAMLLHSESDLMQYAGEPKAFPVFGKGRLLYSLVGKGINRDTVSQTCGFVVGACSCEIKAMNPGVDLLLEGQWDTGGEPGMDQEFQIVSLTGVSSVLQEDAAQAPPTDSGVAPASAAPAPSPGGKKNPTPALPKKTTAPKPAGSPPPAKASNGSPAPAPLPPPQQVTPEERKPHNLVREHGHRLAAWVLLGAAGVALLAVAGGGLLFLRSGKE